MPTHLNISSKSIEQRYMHVRHNYVVLTDVKLFPEARLSWAFKVQLLSCTYFMKITTKNYSLCISKFGSKHNCVLSIQKLLKSILTLQQYMIKVSNIKL